MTEKEKKTPYVSRRVQVNEYTRKVISASNDAEYNHFVGSIMKLFGVSERFVRDVLRAYEMTGDIVVDKKNNKIMIIKDDK